MFCSPSDLNVLSNRYRYQINLNGLVWDSILCFYIERSLLNLLDLKLVKIVRVRSVIRIQNNNRSFVLDLNLDRIHKL
jgi:hypothetical protein